MTDTGVRRWCPEHATIYDFEAAATGGKLLEGPW
jgi:hypothetical protein